jgi:hypothetical protein
MENTAPDFEGVVRFLTAEEGGRSGRWGSPRQGYRCDVQWDADSSDLLWMIWPIFLDGSGQELPKSAVVPKVSRAHFHIVSEATRARVYQHWLREGAGFHLCEGARRVASCRVTKILRLHEPAALESTASPATVVALSQSGAGKILGRGSAPGQ